MEIIREMGRMFGHLDPISRGGKSSLEDYPPEFVNQRREGDLGGRHYNENIRNSRFSLSILLFVIPDTTRDYMGTCQRLSHSLYINHMVSIASQPSNTALSRKWTTTRVVYVPAHQRYKLFPRFHEVS